MVKVQWYPGHMEKAKRGMLEKLKAVDMIIELRDARMPESSRNPMLIQMANQKPRLIVLSKMDQADPVQTELWLKKLQCENVSCIAVDLMRDPGCGKKIIQAALNVVKEKRDRQRAKGINPRAVRAMAAGIPNVGKSTMINRIAGKNTLKAADKPGVTRSLTWLHADKELDLLDTPGVLWPKFENQEIALNLAYTGTIKAEILEETEVAYQLTKYLVDNQLDELIQKYGIEKAAVEDILSENEYKENEKIVEIMNMIGRKRGAIIKGGNIDLTKVSKIILDDFKNGKLGKITIEKVEE